MFTRTYAPSEVEGVPVDAAEFAASFLLRHVVCGLRPCLTKDGIAEVMMHRWQAALSTGATLSITCDGSQRVVGTMLFAPQVSPISDEIEGLASDFFVESPEVAAGLQKNMEDLGRQKGCTTYFVETFPSIPGVHELLAMNGFTLYEASMVRRLDDMPVSDSVPLPYEIRNADDDDFDFIIGCLVEAHKRALSPEEVRAHNHDRLAHSVHELYLPFDDTYCALVMRDAQVRCGHCLIKLDTRDDYTGAPCATLVDTFVSPSHEGRGFGRMLTNAGLARLRSLGFRLVTGSVVYSGTSSGDRVVNSLAEVGWEAHRQIWRSGQARRPH